jgi:steroid 5-alpha reductase family enzyme
LALAQKYDDMADIEKRAWYQAVSDDECDLLYQLRENAVALSSALANELLWIVAKRSKHAELVDFFLSHGAVLTYTKMGHTLLTKATESNNKIIVLALIEACKKRYGVENECKEFVNRIADPLIGSALQIALEKGYTEIELLLREQGARE